MHGKVIIGMELETKELEKKLKEQEKLLQSYEKEAEGLLKQKAKLEIDTTEARKQIDDLDRQIEDLKKHREGLQSQTGFAYQFDTEHIVELTQQITSILETNNNEWDSINSKIEENANNQAIARGEIEKTNQEIKDIKHNIDISKNLKDIGKGIADNIKKVGRWALAILGIKGAMSFIKSATSTISQYDDKMASDLEYIRYALATTIKPIIEWIIQAFYKILALIGYVIKKITKKNIFDNAGVENFNKNLKGASKNAKELNKQLSGFDEANVLSDTSSASTGGGGTPSLNLKDAVDSFNPEEVKGFWETIEQGVKGARKSLKDYQKDITKTVLNISGLEKFYGKWSTLIFGIELVWKGFVDVVAGVWDIIEGLVGMAIDIITGDWDSLGEHFKQFIEGIWEVIKGLYELVVSKIAIVLGVIRGILQTIAEWLWEHVLKPVIDFYVKAYTKIWEIVSGVFKKIIEKAKEFFNFMASIPENLKNAFQTAINKVGDFFSNLWKNIKGGVSSVKTKIEDVFRPIKNGAKSFINFIIDGVNKLIRGLNKIQFDVPDWVPVIGGKKLGFDIKEIPRLAQGGIVEAPKGVMMGSYVAGESGKEGVLPLTNPTTMAQLGQEIGKWVNIAIDNRLEVDGQVLATTTNNHINKENFLMNR